jgi:hypothetical protein
VPVVYILKSDCPDIQQDEFYRLNVMEDLTNKVITNLNEEEKKNGVKTVYVVDYEIMATIQGINQFCRGNMKIGDESFLNHLYNVQKKVSKGELSVLCDAFNIEGVADTPDFLADYLELQNWNGAVMDDFVRDRDEINRECTNESERKHSSDYFNTDIFPGRRKEQLKVNMIKSAEDLKKAASSITVEECKGIIKRNAETLKKVL